MDAFPIAIVGIGCRFPGKVNAPDDFWRLLCDGRDAIGPFPAGRFDIANVFDGDRARPGKMYVANGGFIEGVDQFDAAFFGISPREAAVIDPQHRLLLEVSYEAFEDAGIALERLAGSLTGVFVGISTHDYGDIQMYPGNRGQIGSHSNSGTATSIAANRVSYIYDLRGPSMTVDTACSSALTATHLACQSLARGECDAAIVGGVHLVLTPEPTIGFCKASMLSPDERCHAFDAAANGYVRSEGVGVVVLKPLDAALADRDAVYAVIKGTAVNQDGHTNGMTVPSQAAQAAMLQLALDRAGLAPEDIDYVEAHGTGTPVGDPIEAGAIGAALGRSRSNRSACVIGSVKTNIGHLEAASGIAGLIKATLAVAHHQIPPSLHFTTPNPAIDFDGLGLRVATTLEPWPQSDRPATAGVNSFGFGGANAHVIVQEAPKPATEAAASTRERAELLLLSARSEEALTASARAYLDFLASNPEHSLADICGGTVLRRSHHAHRAAIVAASHDEMIDALDSLVAGERRAEISAGRASSDPGRVAFVFGGMGPQWWGMGRQLMRDEPVFREVIDQCDALLAPIARWSLLEMLLADEASSRVADANVAQVTNFAIQAALAALWRSWGIVPDAVIGHSAGGIAASHVAGVHDLADTVLLAYHRSRLQSRASGQGTMLAVGLGATAAEEAIATFRDRVWLAAVNSPTSCALSGDSDALEEIRVRLQEGGVFARLLQVAVPYHSARMDSIHDELLESLGLLKTRPAKIGLVSDVTGDWADGTGYDAGYWWRTVRQTVRFAEGIATLIDAGFDTFVELSPHPVLSNSVNECLAAKGRSGLVVPSLRRQDDDRKVILRSLAALAVRGHSVRWEKVNSGFRHYVKLPSYPWRHERYWFESQAGAGDGVSTRRAEVGHPLLGARLHTSTPLWEVSLGAAVRGWLDDHIVQGAVVFPAAAYVEMALAAAAEVAPNRIATVRNLDLTRALFLPVGHEPQLQTGLDHDSRLTIHSAPGETDSDWTAHATARIEWLDPPVPPAVVPTELRSGPELSRAAFYQSLTERGLAYGSSFTGITRLWHDEGTALGEVDIAVQGLSPDPYRLHPALLDAAFQVLIAAASNAADGMAQHRQLLVPVHIDSVTLYRSPGTRAWSHARVSRREPELLVGEVDILDDDGAVCATVRGLRCAPFSRQGREGSDSIRDWLYEFRWERDDRPVRTRLAPAAESAALGIQADADARSAAAGWQLYYTDVEPHLDRLAAQLAADAFRVLGWDAECGTVFRTADLIDRLGIVLASAPLTRRLLLMLADIGVLAAPVDDSWQVLEPLPSSGPQALAQEILAAHPAYGTDISLISRCGGALGGVLRGEADSREVLFGADGLADLTQFYRGAPASSYYGALLVDAVVAAAARAEEPVRILEIGGGTGGVTAPLLENLPLNCEYLFTDVSPLFTSRASERFGGREGFTARVLDIERDPTEQGFSSRSADIVIAANVLHATADLAKTLAHVRRLLAPGGLLVLLEITRQPRWLDIVFGVTDGWWKFCDHGLRPDHALLDPQRWTALLASEGFPSPAVIADTDHPGSPGQAVIVARTEDRRAAGTWLVLADSGDVGDRLRSEFTRRGGNAVLVRPAAAFRQCGRNEFEARLDDAGDIGRVANALAERELRGAVLLSALDAKGETSDALLAAQSAVCDAPLAALSAMRQARVPALWLVTTGATTAGATDRLSVAQAPLWGLARVMMREQAEVRCRLVDLDAVRSDAALAALVDEVAGNVGDEEVALRDCERWVHRLARLDEAPSAMRIPTDDEGWRIETAVPGALATIAARAAPRQAPGPRQVEIAVCAAGLNFRDVMLAAGMIPSLAIDQTFGERGLGLDCAGRIARCGSEVIEFAPGDEVIAIAPNALGAFVTTNVALVARKPAALEFEAGAALPCAFVTAHYALDRLALLQRSERVLIHAATGGVGLAAIQIARRAGAEIFATAGTEEKRAYLRSLGIEHAMDSRSLAFADQILEATSGEGVDVVLNSLAGEAIPKGIAILRPYGRFVEIGKRDIYGDSRIGLLPFRKNISFFAVDLDRLCNERPELAGEMLRDIVDGFQTAAYSVLPQQIFPASQAEDAVRLMAQARHIGKVILRTADPELKIAAPRAVIRPEGTYLITGGLGGFGLATAHWLVRRGARSLALMGRRTLDAGARAAVERLQTEGARVDVFQGDVACLEDVRRVLAAVRENGRLRGLVHCAMVLDDAPLTEMTPERLRTALAPKMAGAWNLHIASGEDELDLFVMYSSLVTVIGNPLQANYAAANAFLDGLAHHRRGLGLPALAVQWGVIADAGYVARHPDVADYLSRQGYESFDAEQALDALSDLLERDATEAVAARIDWRKFADYSPATSASSSFQRFAPAASPEAATAQPQASWATAIVGIVDPDERLIAVEQYLRDKVGKVLGMRPERMDASKPLVDIGLDSLIAVELVTTLKLELGFELPVVKLLQGLALSGLAALIAKTPTNSTIAHSAAHGPVSPIAQEPALPAEPALSASVPIISAPSESVTLPAGQPVGPAATPVQRWTTAQQLVRWCAHAGFALGTRITVNGVERIPRTGGLVLATNHLSFLDVPAMLTVMPRPVTLLAAEWLQANPAFRWVLGDIGRAIFVRRGEGDREALDAAVAVLRAGGVIGIGPEGAINRTGGLLPGRPGVAYLATTGSVPVLPVAIWGQEKLIKEWRRLRRPEVYIEIGEPLFFPLGAASVPELQRYTDQIMRAIAALLPSSYRGFYAEVTQKAA